MHQTEDKVDTTDIPVTEDYHICRYVGDPMRLCGTPTSGNYGYFAHPEVGRCRSCEHNCVQSGMELPAGW